MTLSELLKSTRHFFWNLNFEEVEVSYLNESLPLEPNLYSFETIWRSHGRKFYLPTSPELALKSHLATHPSDCFSISHCFRDLENSGPHHRPEFLMLEWYQVNKTLSDIKSTTEKYLHHLLPNLTFTNLTLPTNLPDNEPDFNQFFLNNVEPSLPPDQAVFITGYPAFLSPLAVANQRFELYINGIEIANACEENLNAEQIKSAFLNEESHRHQLQLPSHPYSQKFIDDISSLPQSAGIGLGLERLLMIINHQKSL
jgi:lysyl-tRNA synthetase class 2